MTLTPLTQKQEAFVKAYVETGNASEAYRSAYRADGWTTNALNVEACKMLKHPKIVLRLKELQAAAQERHNITVDRLTEMTLSAFQEAQRVNPTSGQMQTSSMIKAAEFLGKLHGLIVDRTELSGGMTMTHEQRLDELEKRANGELSH